MIRVNKYLPLLYCMFVLTFAKAQYIVFVDSINVRESPSITSKVIGQLRHNSPVQVDYNEEFSIVNDSVGGFKSQWYHIKFNNGKGYIWSPLLTYWNITSKTFSHTNFLLHYSGKNRLQIKVFKKDSLLHSASFECHVQDEMVNFVSIGSTFNSNGKEIIGLRYQSENYKYDLFEWDGKTLKASTIKLNDPSPITGKYTLYTKGYINSNQVKMRATPDVNGTVVNVLGKSTPVSVSRVCSESITLNGEWGCWQPIRYNNKEGFVWSAFIDFPLRYIKSNSNEKESFLFATHAIYAFEEDKIVGRFKFRNRNFSYIDSTRFSDFYNYRFTNYGCRGLDTKYSILGIHFPRESGQQEDFYIWDGLKFNYFGIECSGEDYMCSTYTYPDVSGIKDRIIETKHEENNFINYDNIRYYEQNYLMQFNGDSLVEVPSKYSWLREDLKNKFPALRIADTRYVDLDADGIEDVLFTLQNTKGAQVVGFAFGNAKGNFGKFKYNTSIASKGVVFELECTTPNNIEIKIEYNETDCSIYRYTYEKTLDNYIWQSVTTIRRTNDDNGRHTETKIEQFKTKKILFENSWQSNLFQNTTTSENNEE